MRDRKDCQVTLFIVCLCKILSPRTYSCVLHLVKLINVTWWCFRAADRQDKITLFPLPVSLTSTSSRDLVPSASFRKLQKWVLLEGGHQRVPFTTVQKADIWPHTLPTQRLPWAPHTTTTEFTHAGHRGEQSIHQIRKHTYRQSLSFFFQSLYFNTTFLSRDAWKLICSQKSVSQHWIHQSYVSDTLRNRNSLSHKRNVNYVVKVLANL